MNKEIEQYKLVDIGPRGSMYVGTTAHFFAGTVQNAVCFSQQRSI